jgi:polyphosphate kinase
MLPSVRLAKLHNDLTFKPEHFINRELSWLEFNQRVLDEAIDPSNPLLERLKFFCINSSNLDEFFEIRVAGLMQQVESNLGERSPDGLMASDTLAAIHRRVRTMVARQYECWNKDLRPALARAGIRFLNVADLSDKDVDWLKAYYHHEVRAVLTPLAIDQAHPFPQILNKSVNILVQLEMPTGSRPLRHLAVVQMPRILPRLVRLPHGDRQDYVFMAHLIGHHLGDLFPGTRILRYWQFRLTRNSELYIDDEEAGNLLKAVETELHNRRRGDSVRLEIEPTCPPPVRKALRGTFGLDEEEVYLIDGPLNPTRLMVVCDGNHSPELRDAPFKAPVAAAFRDAADLFTAIRQRDVLLHHPYETFESVVAFIEQAAEDPDVLALKMTLYRAGSDRRIVDALINAARDGKQVTAVIELRARFDEANNIQWARELEEAGVNVVYGLVGFKIHAKVCLVLRREKLEIRRYVHLSTGNYNPHTAKLYTDIGYLTCDPDIGEDAISLFNLLTGICQFQPMRKLIVAPFEMQARVIELIKREAENAQKGLPARIIAKMNSLVDRQVIEALYRASEAGVKIELIVRGICCLRPRIPGVSSNIRVVSIVDRFLEHSRVWYFENGCRPRAFIASADWMPRNLMRRIETAFEVEDGELADRLLREVLALPLADNTKARELQADGTYQRREARARQAPRRSQTELMARALATQTNHSGPLKARYTQIKLAARPFSSVIKSSARGKVRADLSRSGRSSQAMDGDNDGSP